MVVSLALHRTAWLACLTALGCNGSDAMPSDAGEHDGASARTDGGDATDGGRRRRDSGTPADSGAEDAPAGFDGGAGSHGYATTFDLTERPISEGGAWSHTGLDWAVVETGGGDAYGTQTGTSGYDDSYAILSGFSPDQSAEAVIHLNAAIDRSCTHEVEILLRWSDAPHDAHGYECNLSFDGSYAQIVRWNGPLGDFTYVGSGSVASVHDGDTIGASIRGNRIAIELNGVEIATATDDTFTTGNPGIGFFRRDCGANSDYGLTSFAATD